MMNSHIDLTVYIQTIHTLLSILDSFTLSLHIFILYLYIRYVSRYSPGTPWVHDDDTAALTVMLGLRLGKLALPHH